MTMLLQRVARCELRVYVPLSSLNGAEGDKWGAYVAQRRGAPLLTEEKPTWSSLEGLCRAAERDDPEAYVTTFRDVLYVCPRRLHLRALMQMLAGRRLLPAAVAEAVMSQEHAAAAARLVERLRAQHPEYRAVIWTQAWHVPAHWFCPFVEEERHFEVTGDGHARVVYRAAATDAVRRVERAAAVTEEAGLGDVLPITIRTLGAFLGSHGAEAMVELDYGSVADLFAPDALADDRSAADVQAALTALSAGDLLRSGAHYATLTARWGVARAIPEQS